MTIDRTCYNARGFDILSMQVDGIGVLWGALPMLYGDGTQADFDVSTSIAMKWNYWDPHSDSIFAELTMQLPRDWQIKTVSTYNHACRPRSINASVRWKYWLR